MTLNRRKSNGSFNGGCLLARPCFELCCSARWMWLEWRGGFFGGRRVGQDNRVCFLIRIARRMDFDLSFAIQRGVWFEWRGGFPKFLEAMLSGLTYRQHSTPALCFARFHSILWYESPFSAHSPPQPHHAVGDTTLW